MKFIAKFRKNFAMNYLIIRLEYSVILYVMLKYYARSKQSGLQDTGNISVRWSRKEN